MTEPYWFYWLICFFSEIVLLPLLVSSTVCVKVMALRLTQICLCYENVCLNFIGFL